ncbi:MAG TPA: ester cyclase [Acidimicrobiia bacterium]|nr:ester cyclase [Acidimicrobiia bacterium]
MELRDISEAPPHIRAVINGYAALNRRDFDAAVPTVDEANLCTTRDAIRGRLEALVRAFSDITVRNLRAFDLGDGAVAVTFRMTGTNDGPIDADTPPTGRYFEADMLDYIRFDASGRIVDGRNLSDMGPINEQLGLRDGTR